MLRLRKIPEPQEGCFFFFFFFFFGGGGGGGGVIGYDEKNQLGDILTTGMMNKEFNRRRDKMLIELPQQLKAGRMAKGRKKWLSRALTLHSITFDDCNN